MPDRDLFGVSAALFCGSAALTIHLCTSMSETGGMPMPGGWTMSMAWMRMPEQTWSGAAASFLGMWIVMMVAMMPPSLVPTLRRCRDALVTAQGTRPGRLTTLVAVGYFVVWTAAGIAVFPLGVALAGIEMRHPEVARAVPVSAGVAVLIAGAFQLTGAKARFLACCRAPQAAGAEMDASHGAMWRHGLRLGAECVRCCGNLMTIVLVVGVMDLRVMALVTAAITAERLAPGGDRVARTIGALVVTAGAVLIVRAAGVA